MKKIYYTLALLVLLVSACKKESNTLESPEQKVALGKVIVYHLKNGGQVTVVINNRGEYVVGGDVILSKNQIAYLECNKIGDDKTVTTESTFTNELQKLWPGGIVYYTINNPSKHSYIVDAINHWEANTLIRFVQRTNQNNYVDFAGTPEQGGGSSQLGMVGGRQEIKLDANAALSTVIHEIGHAVGLMHEQTRADRDQFINVNYNNISSSWRSQYDIYSAHGIAGSENGTFDFNSIMLYRSYAPEVSLNGNTSPQMTRKDGSIWNNNYYLSQGDIAGVTALYSIIYYRIVYLGNEVYQQDDWNDVYDSIYEVRFYSDPSFTIPFEIQRDISFGVNYTKTQYQYSEQGTTYGMYYEITAPRGSSSVSLWPVSTSIHYNGSMGMQAGSFYDGLGNVGILNGFGVARYN
ncbi:M12 family metallopeptidase [Pedobacter sp. MR22-3]|uniref:M12 family metallopeptidase n=1 Tax=Pedobacter sp. MR22-3 TaxID=2994552 RepID=UPI002248236E|nr:M12 family metallopeptidase [Pedobacter sp. MR22-3]MCX2584018.1 M12 family metallopeptidase [Pedobacter sp. MR22-3]